MRQRCGRCRIPGLGPDAIHINVAAAANHAVEHGTAVEEVQHAPARGFADDDLRHVLLPGNPENCGDHVLIAGRDDFSAKFTREFQVLMQSGLLGVRK